MATVLQRGLWTSEEGGGRVDQRSCCEEARTDDERLLEIRRRFWANWWLLRAPCHRPTPAGKKMVPTKMPPHPLFLPTFLGEHYQIWRVWWNTFTNGHPVGAEIIHEASVKTWVGAFTFFYDLWWVSNFCKGLTQLLWLKIVSATPTHLCPWQWTRSWWNLSASARSSWLIPEVLAVWQNAPQANESWKI